MKQQYIDAVTARIGSKAAKKQIAAELDSHITEKIAYYTDLGYSSEEAERRAVADMGEPDDAALPLRELHNKKRTTALLWIALAYTLLVYAAEWLLGGFRYSSGLTYILSERTGTPHAFRYDIYSFLIVAGFVALLVLAYRQKSRAVPLIIALFLLFMLGSEWLIYRLQDILPVLAPNDWEGICYSLLETPLRKQMIECVPCAVFQPFLFAALKLATAGLGGYIESVFASAYADEQLKALCSNGAMLVCAALIVWAVAQLVLVSLQIRMKRTKSGNRVMKWFQRVVCVLLALYLSVILACAGAAGLKYRDTSADASEEKTAMIEEVITCHPTELNVETLHRMGYHDYSPGHETEYMLPDFENKYFYRTNTNNLIALSPDYGYGDGMVSFTTTQEIAAVSEEEYDLLNSDEIATLEDFLKLGIYRRASRVEHMEDYMEEEHVELLTFTFPYRGSQLQQVTCAFTVSYPADQPRPDWSAFTFEYLFP